MPDLGAVRALLHDVFDDLADEDVEHALGGWHALVHDDGVLVGHGSVVRRQFLVGGLALPVGYVEAVAVAAGHRRRGVGTLVMDELERVLVAGHGVGFLGASDEGALMYAARGWPVWRGPLAVLATTGVRATPDERGGVRVFDPAGRLDLDAELVCEWRSGDVW
nr:GNAT family N-acetyltransferase [Kineococcus aurantiacus]